MGTMEGMPAIAHLECSLCHYRISRVSGLSGLSGLTGSSDDTPATVCPVDGGPLYVRYDMEALKQTARREHVAEIAAGASAEGASAGMWRYAEVLPSVPPVSLGEGWTPLLRSRRYPGLLLKAEGANPAGTFKARGLSMAVSMARQYGLRHLALAAEGDAAGALAAYAAAGQMKAHLLVPRDVLFADYVQAVACGAEVRMVDGLAGECERLVGAERKRQAEAGVASRDAWFDLSMLQEPFRLEGEKTMGYELVEQLGWEYPDAVIFPADDGATGVMGMWKAFEEMEQLGWVAGERPRMYTARTAKPYGESGLAEVVRASGGRVVAAPDDAGLLATMLNWAREEGIFLSPEGAAATAAYDTLRVSGEIQGGERVVLFHTGAGLKYADWTAEAMHLRRPGRLPTSLPVGGIITPV